MSVSGPQDRTVSLSGPIAVVGGGRLGSVLVRRLTEAGCQVTGPHGRGYHSVESPRPQVVLLCVPDDAIATAAGLLVPGPWVGHLSGASPLAVLAPHRAFSLHPLMTVTGPDTELRGVPVAVAGGDSDALAVAEQLAFALGMTPFVVAEADRVTYHAAAAFASNFLITVEVAAARLMTAAGVDPRLLQRLAAAALRNVGDRGAAALTGPVARGDRGTVAAHRAAIEQRATDLLPLFDALVAATETLAGQGADQHRREKEAV